MLVQTRARDVAPPTCSPPPPHPPPETEQTRDLKRQTRAQDVGVHTPPPHPKQRRVFRNRVANSAASKNKPIRHKPWGMENPSKDYPHLLKTLWKFAGF